MRETRWRLRGDAEWSALEWGEPVGVPSVFLHGFLDHAGAWARTVELLSGWRIALDHRGHGLSPHCGPLETYHFPEYLADLDALLRQVGPAKLVGHSMGGTIASMYAGARPERVLALATVDGLGLHDMGEEAVDRMQQFLDEVERPPVNKVFPSVEAAAARLRQSNLGLAEGESLRLAERILRPVDGGLTWTWDSRHRIRAAVPYRIANHQLFLRRIRCPVLAVRPEFSPFQPENVAALHGCIEQIQVATIPGASHMVHLDAPEALAAVLRPFLDAPPIQGVPREALTKRRLHPT
jgi:pimeloyl-ACP methyl ester carboxylesterase